LPAPLQQNTAHALVGERLHLASLKALSSARMDGNAVHDLPNLRPAALQSA